MAAVNQNFFENEQLDISGLPKFEEIPLTPLAPKYLLKRNISSAIWMIILSGIVVAAYLTVPAEYHKYLLWFGLFLILNFGWSIFQNYQLLKKIGFAVRERDLIFKTGFLFENITIVPFNRVQHVSTSRSALEKILGLSTLKIFTAGGSGSDISIPGLIPETAASLKEALAVRISGHV